MAGILDGEAQPFEDLLQGGGELLHRDRVPTQVVTEIVQHGLRRLLDDVGIHLVEGIGQHLDGELLDGAGDFIAAFHLKYQAIGA